MLHWHKLQIGPPNRVGGGGGGKIAPGHGAFLRFIASDTGLTHSLIKFTCAHIESLPILSFNGLGIVVYIVSQMLYRGICNAPQAATHRQPTELKTPTWIHHLGSTGTVRPWMFFLALGLHVHGIAAQHPNEGCQLREVADGVLTLGVSHAGNEVYVDKVPEECPGMSGQANSCPWELWRSKQASTTQPGE